QCPGSSRTRRTAACRGRRPARRGSTKRPRRPPGTWRSGKFRARNRCVSWFSSPQGLFESGCKKKPHALYTSAVANRNQKETAMTTIDKLLYMAKTHTTGGRDGASRTSDGRLDVKLATPGTAGVSTNPEQLFAAGWSACFLSAIGLVASQKKLVLPADRAIDAEVDLRTTTALFLLP